MSKKPVLYLTAHSVPCRAVRLTAAEIGVDLELRFISLKKGEHLTPEFIKLNPLHTIPVLDDNGIIITDSHVICGYLVDKYSKNDKLYPKELVARNNVLTRLFYDCGNLFPRACNISGPIFYGGCTEIDTDRIEYIQMAYDGVEYCLTGNPYLCGDTMTIADLCCIATISSTHDMAPIDKKKFPNLWAWVVRMSKLPYYIKCNQDGADKLKELLAQQLEENKKQALK